MLREAVELNGYHVQVAVNGEAGLGAARTPAIEPAVIMCDIALPHMNGLELLRQMRLNPALDE